MPALAQKRRRDVDVTDRLVDDGRARAAAHCAGRLMSGTPHINASTLIGPLKISPASPPRSPWFRRVRRRVGMLVEARARQGDGTASTRPQAHRRRARSFDLDRRGSDLAVLIVGEARLARKLVGPPSGLRNLPVVASASQ
jgi:hypothetical protein